MIDQESIPQLVWCQISNLLSILTNDQRQHFRCLFLPRFLPVWNFKDFRIMIDFAWGNGSIGGKSIFSLQCWGLTPSLPSEIDSSSFSQGSRIGFSITLPLWRVMTNWTWSMCWLPELLTLELYCPLGFCCGWDETPENWEQMWILQEYL